VRTAKDVINLHSQAAVIENIQTENALLPTAAVVTYVGWLTKTGRKKTASSLVVEFETRQQVNWAIQEALVLGAYQHDRLFYDRACKFTHCFRCENYGQIETQC
jgi:hypothetical protein